MDRARSTRCCEAGNLALNVQLLDHGSRPLDSQPAKERRHSSNEARWHSLNGQGWFEAPAPLRRWQMQLESPIQLSIGRIC